MLAQLLLGCSGSPIFTLGTTYIDDHVKRDTASVYLGVIYSMVAFGPVLGKYRLLLLPLSSMFLGLLDPHPDPLVKSTAPDADAAPDP